jgi:hypothetical protein
MMRSKGRQIIPKQATIEAGQEMECQLTRLAVLPGSFSFPVVWHATLGRARMDLWEARLSGTAMQ